MGARHCVYHPRLLRERRLLLSGLLAADNRQHDFLPHGPRGWLLVVFDRAGQDARSDSDRLRRGSPSDRADVSRLLSPKVSMSRLKTPGAVPPRGCTATCVRARACARYVYVNPLTRSPEPTLDPNRSTTAG